MIFPYLLLIEKSHKKIPAEIREALYKKFREDQEGFFKMMVAHLGHNTYWVKASRKDFEELAAML